MTWQKLDAALASALEEIQDVERSQFDITIQTSRTPGPCEREYLETLGVPNTSSGTIFAAKVSASDIYALSDKPWVRALRLARTFEVAV